MVAWLFLFICYVFHYVPLFVNCVAVVADARWAAERLGALPGSFGDAPSAPSYPNGNSERKTDGQRTRPSSFGAASEAFGGDVAIIRSSGGFEEREEGDKPVPASKTTRRGMDLVVPRPKASITLTSALGERERVEMEIISTSFATISPRILPMSFAESLLASYFNIVRKTFLDLVPKTIMAFMVNNVTGTSFM